MSDVLSVDLQGPIAVLTMTRPDKRNAMNDTLLAALDAFFSAPPEGAKVVVLVGTAGHYCSGLDLSEHVARNAEGTLKHSRGWHGVMDKIQFSGLPVVSAMFGAVIGGGLELATSTHVRIAEPSVIFQLPEGRRGIFVGGGATVRVGRILGADRMTEMMLTGRKYGAEEGLRLGLCHYAVGEGEALDLAMELAGKIAKNASLSNYIMINAISRINDMARGDGFFTESLSAAIAQTSEDAKEGLRAFLEKRAPEFR
ncbi:enoyl-CoA hydratase [Pseudooceanicola sediminis]|uniref:Enoyl-CoA hydratase n=1 Tax=Pseudooceanicola sediminis TaxID=2211117 RepID=A0A399J3N4_9RHOB|nr:crotonase/enoyl-CoA hydratase family protein [Pseudooceanicola sediminis]KAA2313603.1 crotonase/enoyl-CoA hydratase family protein [Puniceibacterium sp. HSS470]RII38552.1 enoyl-CoA hydratase [Pseudooceanicola sediminis]|tara:strand:+ start:6961 stop:7725 length:765 start_codon:yes stop_codon:yes gene_type:complete